jgi:octaprenyl-diphosphate synthase
MVHLATLVHDDIIDEAKLRRGKPTVTAKWGNELSVLLGDCLFARALELSTTFPTTEICRAVASATNTVCAGEILQSRSRGNFGIDLSQYYKILGMKTAELFVLSCDLGGLCGNATRECREALRQYGMALGTAYQVYDDCLDLLGVEANAGKTLGADLAEGKLTLPVLLVRERATQAEREQLRAWVRNWDPAFLPDMLQIIKRHNALHLSRAVVQDYLTAARQALTALPEGGGRSRLYGVTDFLAQQTEALGVI